MDGTHDASLIMTLNRMSINFLEMLTSENEDGIIVPAQYIIEDGLIKGVIE